MNISTDDRWRNLAAAILDKMVRYYRLAFAEFLKSPECVLKLGD